MNRCLRSSVFTYVILSEGAPTSERPGFGREQGALESKDPCAYRLSRAAQFFFSAAIAIALAFSIAPRVHASNPDMPEVQLHADRTTGRPLEELTKKAVVRDYASAWHTLAKALNDNNAGVLDNDFVGIAQEKLQKLVAEQSRASLRTHYVDHGHTLDVLFYSPEGSSIQVRDTAHLEIQIFDGDKLIHSEQATLHYISLLTPTEVRWKVRLLQAVPEQSSK